MGDHREPISRWRRNRVAEGEPAFSGRETIDAGRIRSYFKGTMTHAALSWMSDYPWEAVLATNVTLCEARQAGHQVREPGHTKARQLWEQSCDKSLPLLEAIEICRRCSDAEPFVCANATTFADIGRKLITQATAHLPGVEAQILRTTVCHYIAGRVLRKELLQIWPLLAKNPAPTADAPTNDSGVSPASSALRAEVVTR